MTSAVRESRWKLPVFSALLLSVAYYLPWLVPNFVAFVPLLCWLDAGRGRSYRATFRQAFVYFGLLTHLINLHFYLTLLEVTWLSGLLYVGFVLALALKLGCLATLLGWLRHRTGWSWGLLLPLCWLPFEWLQTLGDLRLTGDHVAYSLTGYPFLIQFADLVGPYGVGAFLLAANGLLYEVRRAPLRVVVLFAVVLGYDAWAWSRPLPDGETLRVAVVQPNISLAVKLNSEQTRPEQWQVLEELSRRAAALEPDLIVWPESAAPWRVTHWLDRPQTYAMPLVQALARELGVPLLVGVEYLRVRAPEDYELYNAAMLVDETGELGPRWSAKVYLVPFVEALPFRGLLRPLLGAASGEWRRWVDGAFESGPRDQLFRVGGTRVGVLVCMEQLFPELGTDLRDAGAELQVVITNDAWWHRTRFQRYQADVLRLRAIENRSEFVRVANTGISGFVDRRGRYHHTTALFERAVEVRDVELAGAPTVYNRIGDVVVWLAIVGLLAALARARRARRAAGTAGAPR